MANKIISLAFDENLYIPKEKEVKTEERREQEEFIYEYMEMILTEREFEAWHKSKFMRAKDVAAEMGISSSALAMFKASINKKIDKLIAKRETFQKIKEDNIAKYQNQCSE